MWRTSDVGEVVHGIILCSTVALFVAHKLQTIVAHDDVDRAALSLKGRDGLLQGLDGRDNNALERFLYCQRCP